MINYLVKLGVARVSELGLDRKFRVQRKLESEGVGDRPLGWFTGTLGRGPLQKPEFVDGETTENPGLRKPTT